MKKVLALAVLALTVGCGGSSDATAPGGAPNPVGSYSLATLNGQALPASFQSGATTITVNSDAYTLNSDHTFSEHGSASGTDGSTSVTVPITDSGTWTQSGNALTFSSAANGTWTGALSGSSITITENAIVEVYRKN